MATLGVEQHAMMYVFLVKAALDRFGKSAEATILQATRNYGERRGQRMAARAKADGLPNDFVSYMLYGELNMNEAGNVFDTVQTLPHVKMHVPFCGWHQTWAKHGVMDYARFYCQVIDEAIMHGFNPDARLGVEGTMPNGAEKCTFHWFDGKIGPEEGRALAVHRSRLGDTTTKPWGFHIADLCQAMKQTFVEKYGTAGSEIAAAALAAFRDMYGGEAAAAVEAMALQMPR